MSLMYEVLNCGAYDFEYAENVYNTCVNISNDFQLDLSEGLCINSIIWQCMTHINTTVFSELMDHYLLDLNVSDEILYSFESYCEKQLNEPDIFVNYIDSFFSNILDEIDFNSFSSLETIVDEAINLILNEVMLEAA